MIKIYLSFYCLLSALSIVEMKPLNVEGRVGENVTFECSDWSTWFNLEQNVKYFCYSPCSTDKDIISKAAFGETKHNNRITLVNRGKGLFVTFTNLQKSDFKTYICGVEREGFDRFIEVNLIVRAAEASSPKTTPEPVVAGSTLSSADTTTVSSTGSDVATDMPSSNTSLYSTASTTSATQAGIAPYFIGGLILIVVVVMVGLILTRKMMKKQQMVVSSPEEDTGGSPAGPDEVYQSLDPLTMDKDQVYSTLPNRSPAGPDEVYQSLHPSTMDKDQVYSTLPNRNAALESMGLDSSSGS